MLSDLLPAPILIANRRYDTDCFPEAGVGRA
jgi:hypothetical protein